MSHYHSLKALFPIDLGPLSDAEMQVEGSQLDSALMQTESLTKEFFSATATNTLEQWEREYAIPASPEKTIEDRRMAINARMLERAGMSTRYFVDVAWALGYEIEITESPQPFRAGISKAGDRVYAPGVLWEWTVLVVNAHEAPELVELFNDLNPPHLRLTFVFA